MVLFLNNLLNVPLKLRGRSDFSRITISRGQSDLYIAIIIYVLWRWPLVHAVRINIDNKATKERE